MFHSHLNYSVLSLFLLMDGFSIMWESGLSYLLLIKVLDWYLHIQCSFWFIPISPGRQLQEVAEQGILTSQTFRAFFFNKSGRYMDLRVGTGPGHVPPGTGIILIRVQLIQPKIRDWDM